MQNFTISLLILVVVCADLCCAQLMFPLTKKVGVSSRRQRFLGSKALSITNGANSVYMLQILVGNSKSQLQVQLDTGSYVLWFASSACNGCGTSYPDRYNCQTSDSCNLQTGSTSSGEFLFGDGTHIYGTKGTVLIQLADGTKLTSQPFLYVTKGENIVSGNEDGIFGLGPYDPYNSNANQNWVNTLYSAGTISLNQFSMYLSNANNSTSFNDQLMLGTVDQSYIKTGATTNTHIVTSADYWNIQSSRVLLGGSVLGTAGYDTLIDSGTSYMSFPTDLFNSMKDILVNQYKLQYDSSSSVFYDNCVTEYPTLTFEMQNTSGQTITYTLEPEFYAVYDSSSKQCGIVIGQMDGQIILGDVFMQKYLSTFTYGANPTVSLSQSVSLGTWLPFQNQSLGNDSKGFPLWAKIVIPIAAVLFLAILATAAYSTAKKRNLAKRNLQNQQQQPSTYPVNSHPRQQPPVQFQNQQQQNNGMYPIQQQQPYR